MPKGKEKKLNERQEKLFRLVVETHIETAQPVGSKFLVKQEGLDWSEATVRNDLRALEEIGYLTHPHTSAGRVPTAAGYRHYINTMNLGGVKISGKDEKKVEEILTGEKQDFETGVRTLAKGLAQISGEAIIYAYGPDKVYYTGLSNLFGKKEFTEPELIVNISSVFDNCEEYLDDFETMIMDDPRFFLGTEQPFGEDLSVLATRVRKDKSDMLMMVGLNRMDYKRNYALIQKISEILNSL
ncbi:MAG TPA: hypothetical protein P5230_03585 [Candidatus Magasanikbacteria bacterium]|nr:hypothetical protein [Candidatus Magasanikbacteria bacterium]